MSAPAARTPSPLWLLPPAILFGLEIAAVLANGENDQPTNAAYHFGDVIGLAVFTLVLGLYAVAAVHFSRLDLRETLAIRRTPLRPAIRDGVAALAVIVVANLVLNPLLNADQAQGIVPEHSPRNTQEWLILGLALLIVGVLVPICEELFFRGLAYASLGRFAVVGSAVLFASAHVLPEVLPIVLIAGLALAEVRKRTDSVIPGMFVHSALNLSALLLAVLA